MTRRFGRFAALLCAAALLAGACSDGGEEQAAENPQQAFGDALDALSEYEGISVEMTIEADTASLTAQDDMTEEEAQKLLDSSLTLSAKGETVEDAQAEIVVNVAGNEDAVELRVLDQTLYARIEVRDLVEEFGGNVADIDTTVQQATAQGFDFAQPLADGEWVGIEGLDELAEQFGGGAPSPDSAEAQAIVDELAQILDQNADVTSEGTDDVGAHLVVTVPLRETVQESLDALQGLSGVPAGAIPPDATQDVPDADIPIDVWVSDGRIVQLEFDIVAISEEVGEPQPEGVDNLALRLALDEFTEGVEAPSDFTSINLQEILQTFFGGLGTM